MYRILVSLYCQYTGLPIMDETVKFQGIVDSINTIQSSLKSHPLWITLYKSCIYSKDHIGQESRL